MQLQSDQLLLVAGPRADLQAVAIELLAIDDALHDGLSFDSGSSWTGQDYVYPVSRICPGKLGYRRVTRHSQEG